MKKTKLNANWIVGFSDGEACFNVSLLTNNTMTNGFQIQPEFIIVQHVLDIHLLEGLKEYFACGSIGVNHGDRYYWRVKNLTQLTTIIIPFFEKYKLKGKRRVEFERFKEICLRMEKKEHLSKEGFLKVQTLAAQLRMNGQNYKEPRNKL